MDACPVTHSPHQLLALAVFGVRGTCKSGVWQIKPEEQGWNNRCPRHAAMINFVTAIRNVTAL